MDALLELTSYCPFCFSPSQDHTGKVVACASCNRPFLAVNLHKKETRCTTTGLSLPEGTARISSALHPTIHIEDLAAHEAAQQGTAESSSRDDLELGKGRYQCTEELGRGGMGVVVRAHDRSLGRDVAIKLLKDSHRPGRLRRFLREAQISGQLAHPNIVPVHDFGIDGTGRVYFTMQLIEGRTLAAHLDDLRAGKEGMPLGRLVRILVQVCNAIELAHSREVIHRDLKPANIMIGSYGEVLVMDWGLARVITAVNEVTIDGVHPSSSDDDSDHPDLTMEGSVLGTPAYMPPEQAEGRNARLDGRSDVYALGAILFELLTLRAPATGRDVHEVLRQVRAGITDLPSRVAPAGRLVPRDLEAVAMRALSRAPAERYQSAAAMGRDLEAWLDGRAVSARTIPLAEMVMVVYRRHRLTAIVSATLGALAVGGLTYAVQLNRTARFAAEAAQAQSELARHDADAARATVAQALASEREQRVTADRERYLSSIALASQELSQEDYGAAVSALASCPENLRDWPWRRLDLLTKLDLLRRTDAPEPGTSLIALAGGHLLTTSRDGYVRLYGDGLRPEGGFQAHRSATMTAALLNDGRILSGGADGTLRLWRIGNENPDRIMVGAAGPMAKVLTDGHLAWSMTIAGQVNVWDLTSGSALRKAELGSEAVLLQEGPQVVARRADGSGVALDAQAAHELPAPVPGYRLLAWNSAGWIAHLGTKLAVVTAAGQLTPVADLGHAPTAAAWSPDGKRIMAQTGPSVQIITLGQPHPLPIVGHAGPVVGAVFVEEGARLATFGEDGSIRLWDAEKRRDVDLVAAVAEASAAAVSSDGGRVVLGDPSGAVALVDVRSRSVLRRWNAGFPITAAALSGDGSLVALASKDGRARVWVADSGYTLVTLPKTKTEIRALAFGLDAKRLAVAASDGRVRVHEVADGHEVYTCHGHAGAVPNLLFGAERLRTGGVDGTVRTFTAHNGERIATEAAHDEAVTALSMTADEHLLATARGRLIEIGVPGQPPSITLHLLQPVQALCFAADGSRLFAATSDGLVRCLDVASGRTLLSTSALPAPATVLQAAGTRDLIAVLRDGSVALLPASR
jgi:WD40 repeat protein